MIFVGLLSFHDPPKEDARIGIQEILALGVRVKVLTGDNPKIAVKVCSEIGLDVKGVVTGEQLETLVKKIEKNRKVDEDVDALLQSSCFGESDKKSSRKLTEDETYLYQLIWDAVIFAKLSPDQKAYVIRILRNHPIYGEQVVGFLGDGINDALALRQADVGISVDTATDLAKESADMILLRKSLTVLANGVREGRVTHGNTLKYIKMTASSNFGNVFSVMVASCWLPFLPMRPLHLLTQNLLYDISQISIPWDNMDADYLTKPKGWSARDLTWFMLFLGPTSSVFDITTFILMYYYYGCTDPNNN